MGASIRDTDDPDVDEPRVLPPRKAPMTRATWLLAGVALMSLLRAAMTPSDFDEQTSFEAKPSADSGGESGTRLIAGIVAMLLGAAALLGGFVLWAGEKADRLVIFPWAGRLTMLVGIAGLAIGAAFAGRRAALILSVVLVMGGIALYAIGLAFVEQLGTRLYQAFGLLSALVGLIAVYASYGMDGRTHGNDPSPAESDKSI